MAMSLDKLENKVQIHHLYVKRFHTVKRLSKSVLYIRRYSTKNAPTIVSTSSPVPYCCYGISEAATYCTLAGQTKRPINYRQCTTHLPRCINQATHRSDVSYAIMQYRISSNKSPQLTGPPTKRPPTKPFIFLPRNATVLERCIRALSRSRRAAPPPNWTCR